MNEDEVQGNPLNPAALDALSKDLESLKQTRKSNAEERLAPSSTTAKAATDFLSALAVCSLIGYGVDYMAGSLPLGLLVGLISGLGVGAKLMLRDMKKDS